MPKNIYLLIIGCSDRKLDTPWDLKAMDRYDGVTYRILKNIWMPESLHVLILSGQFGLLTPSSMIPYYDHRICKSDIKKRNEIKGKLLEYINLHLPIEIFINIGMDYYELIKGFEKEIVSKRYRPVIVKAQGGIGSKGGQMRDWVCSLEKPNVESVFDL